MFSRVDACDDEAYGEGGYRAGSWVQTAQVVLFIARAPSPRPQTRTHVHPKRGTSALGSAVRATVGSCAWSAPRSYRVECMCTNGRTPRGSRVGMVMIESASASVQRAPYRSRSAFFSAAGLFQRIDRHRFQRRSPALIPLGS